MLSAGPDLITVIHVNKHMVADDPCSIHSFSELPLARDEKYVSVSPTLEPASAPPTPVGAEERARVRRAAHLTPASTKEATGRRSSLFCVVLAEHLAVSTFFNPWFGGSTTMALASTWYW